MADAIDATRIPHGSVVTVGTFDGVHRGHRLVLERTATAARERGLSSVVVTFGLRPAPISMRTLARVTFRCLNSWSAAARPASEAGNPRDPGHGRTRLLVDEMAALTAYCGDRELKKRAESALQLLLSQGRAPGVLVVAAVQDPGNVGTILRTAAGLGVTATVALPGTVDLWNAKVVRSGMGAHFRHLAFSTTWSELDAFRDRTRLSVVAADASGVRSRCE